MILNGIIDGILGFISDLIKIVLIKKSFHSIQRNLYLSVYI